MSQSKGYVDADYLRVVGEVVKHLKQRSYALVRIQPGQAPGREKPGEYLWGRSAGIKTEMPDELFRLSDGRGERSRS